MNRPLVRRRNRQPRPNGPPPTDRAAPAEAPAAQDPSGEIVPFPAEHAHPEQQRRARVLAIANQKGGVGKTTTAINLGTALAATGERVLVIDLDPQGNASTGLGIDRKSRRFTTYDVLIGQASLREAILATAVPRLSIAPSTIDLVRRRARDRPDARPRFRLRDALAALAADQGEGVHLCAGRLPALAQPAHGERDGGRARHSRAAAMRVLRARGPVAAPQDRRTR